MATAYPADVIREAQAEVRRKTGLPVVYQTGRWMVYNRSGNQSNLAPALAPATAGQSALWNVELEAANARLHPPSRTSRVVDTLNAPLGSFISPTSGLGRVSAGIGGVTAGIGSVGRTLGGGVLGSVAGGIGAVTGIIGSAFGAIGHVVGAFTSLLGVVGRLGAVIGGVVIGALTALAAALTKAIHTTLEFSHSVISIRNQTGMSVGSSARAALNFQALGISPQQLGGLLQGPNMNPAMFGMRARIYGLSGDISNRAFLPQLAERYQSMSARGPMGTMRAQQMLNVLGLKSPEILNAVNQRPSAIRDQLNYSNRVQSSLGVNPEVFRRYAEGVTNLTTRFGILVQAVEVRLGAELLPMVENILGALTDYLASHATDIANAIRAGVSWLYVEGPVLILRGAQIALAGLNAIFNGLINFGRGMAAFLQAINDGQSGLFTFFQYLGSVIDSIIAGAVALHLTDTQTDIAGDMLNWQNSGTPGKWAANINGVLDDAEKSVRPTLDGLTSTVAKSLTNAENSRDERRAQFALVSAVNENTKATRDNSAAAREGRREGRGTTSDLLGLVNNSVAQNQYAESLG